MQVLGTLSIKHEQLAFFFNMLHTVGTCYFRNGSCHYIRECLSLTQLSCHHLLHLESIVVSKSFFFFFFLSHIFICCKYSKFNMYNGAKNEFLIYSCVNELQLYCYRQYCYPEFNICNGLFAVMRYYKKNFFLLQCWISLKDK